MNVGQVAAAAGLPVRTLHQWGAVGTLVPRKRASCARCSASTTRPGGLAQDVHAAPTGSSLRA